MLNYVRALSGAIQRLEEIPISSRLLREAHAVLLHDVARHRGATIDADQLKRDQNWIGGTGRIETARFIPPPPADAVKALDQLAEYINRENAAGPALIDAALAHYQFEAIHPFADGNGRVGRMLTTLMLIHSGVLTQPLLYMSPWLEKHKDQYIDLMFEVSRQGAWLPWIEFFLEAVTQSALGTIRVVERLQNLQAKYRGMFQTARRSALLPRIIHLAFEHPALTITDIAQRIEVSYQAAANNVAALVSAGVATEYGIYPKVLIFEEIVQALHVDD